MLEVATLEIGLRRRGEGEYTVDFRFRQPRNAADVRLQSGGAIPIHLDPVALRALTQDPARYARELSAGFFSDPQVSQVFNQARAVAESNAVLLRVLLAIEPGAAELHAIYWELLQDPRDETPLSTRENLLFARYLSSQDLRPFQPLPKQDLSALVFVASPSNLADYKFLTPIDIHGEFRRASNSLSTYKTELYSTGPATLNGLFDALNKQKPAILYLVSHSGMLRDEPYLWLEDESGRTRVTPGQELANRLHELKDPPSLVVLASCDSAGQATAGDAGAVLGPLLVEAGIPVVVAMQGQVSMSTLDEFMPAFFRELQRDGQIERAVAVARSMVRDRVDYWMPVLFSRLDEGMLWNAQAAPVRRPKTNQPAGSNKNIPGATSTPPPAAKKPTSAGVNASAEAPNKAPTETLAEGPAEAAAKTAAETPVETSAGAVAEATADAPPGEPVETATHPTDESPHQPPVDVPAEASTKAEASAEPTTEAPPAPANQPLLTIDPSAPVPHQIPPAPDFVSAVNKEELDALLKAVHDEGVTIINIYGTYDIGKNILAYKLANQLIDRFPDGQIRIDMTSGPGGRALTAEEALQQALRSFGVREPFPTDLTGLASQYIELVFGRKLLILLQNAADAQSILNFMNVPQDCLVIITSLEMLNVPGVQVQISGVPLEQLKDYPFNFNERANKIIEKAITLATGITTQRTLTGGMLFFAILDDGKENPGITAKLVKLLSSQSGLNLDEERKSYFTTLYGPGEPAESESGSIPPKIMTPNADEVIQLAASLSIDLDAREIDERHLLAGLLSPGQEGGAFGQLDFVNQRLPLLRENLLLWLRPQAGDQLPVWEKFLLGEQPEADRGPVSYTADDARAAKDLLDIRQDVDAFAALIASRNIAPPLSIGLFGEWGSGKSFFIQQLKQAVERLATQARDSNQLQRDQEYYKRIVQIEFNAWHYMQANIWASLAEHVIRSLAFRGGDQRTPIQEMHHELEERLNIEKQARQDATQEVELARVEQDRVEIELTSAKDDMEAKAEKLANLYARQTAHQFVISDLQPQIQQMVADLNLAPLLEGEQSMEVALKTAQSVVQNASVVFTPLVRAKDGKQRLNMLLLVLIGSPLLGLMVGLVPALLGKEALAQIAAMAAGAGSLLTLGAKWLSNQADWVSKQTQRVAAIQETYDHKMAEALAENLRQIKNLEQSLDAAKARLANAEQKRLEAIQRVAAAQKRLDQATPMNLLADFLQDRAESSDYRKHLGLLAQIRTDFTKLNNLMDEVNKTYATYQTVKEEEESKDRQLNRIVLYIDDLDRCPPAKVVEVLQAVHLLLAFPLFVVVVAVDARWITQSLTSRYREMLHEDGGAPMRQPASGLPVREPDGSIFGKATPDDYLEKIFQIPFWLKPMTAATSRNMIRGLVESAQMEKTTTEQPDSQTSQPSEETPVPEPGGQTPAQPAPTGQAAPPPVEAVLQPDGQPALSLSDAAPQADGPAAGAVLVVSGPPIPAEPAITPPQQTQELQKPEPQAQKEKAALDLRVTRLEEDFMEYLAPLLGRSPRSLKRFINIYRLVKARLTARDLKYFLVKEDAICDYQAVLFLLAIDSGLPDIAPAFFEALDDPQISNPQETAEANGRPLLDRQVEWLLKHMNDLTSTQQPDESPDQFARRREQWKRLKTWLDNHKPSQANSFLHDVPNLYPLAYWAEYVCRYSFKVFKHVEIGDS